MFNDYLITLVVSSEDYRVGKGNFYCVSLHSIALFKRQKKLIRQTEVECLTTTSLVHFLVRALILTGWEVIWFAQCQAAELWGLSGHFKLNFRTVSHITSSFRWRGGQSGTG